MNAFFGCLKRDHHKPETGPIWRLNIVVHPGLGPLVFGSAFGDGGQI